MKINKDRMIEEEEYEEFGSDINGISEKYKYTGKEKDITGLYYFGARYYDPTIGRFITRDPVKGNIMNPQTLNPYVYCLNNPMKYIDLDGESPWDHKWLPDGDVEVDPVTWDTFYDPELREKYRDEWVASHGKMPDYTVAELQVSFRGYYFSINCVTKTETGESEWYIGAGKSYGPPTVQFMGGKAFIENFEDYEGPIVQGGAAYGVAGEVSVDPTTGKIVDVKGGLGAQKGWWPSVGFGITVSVDRVRDVIKDAFKKLKFW